MSDRVSVTISNDVFERLQKMARPLVDTTDTVIERLLDHWDNRPTSKTNAVETTAINSLSSVTTIQQWKSSRGDVLPVGKELRGSYLGKVFHAQVEAGGIHFNGKLYDNLSPAAIAAKNLAGTTGNAASTNGRDFWKLQDPKTRQWIPVSALRPSHRVTFQISAEEMLAELNMR